MTRFGSISQVLEDLAPMLAVSDEPAWEDVLARAERLGVSAATNSHLPGLVPLARVERGSRLPDRAQRRRIGRRGIALAVLGVLALVVVVAAAAYVLGHPVIDFGKA